MAYGSASASASAAAFAFAFVFAFASASASVSEFATEMLSATLSAMHSGMFPAAGAAWLPAVLSWLHHLRPAASD